MSSLAGAVTAPADAGLLVFLAIGVLGGAHCLGMCGPLVTLYADRLDRSGRPRLDWRDVRQHLLFNGGRTASYTLIGGVMGALGAALFDAAAVAAVATDVRAVTGVVVGGFIVLTGAGYLVRGSVRGGSLPVVGSAFARVYGAVADRVDAWVGGPRIVALGALHGLLPCPLLYPAFLYALASGSPLRGALSLAVLGLGTVPTLLAYGTVFQSFDTGARVGLHRALGACFVVLGYLPLAHGLALFGVPLPHPPIPVYQPL
ncbi:sulfite exporter TauE/SafE family protein [Haloplanus sp. C73]|uniref:sulfite exporter TauE/SafE family protein n=1 Tax=Haloplanus sp. C73 TaxID=3421641 RepID=UPI003EC0E8D3